MLLTQTTICQAHCRDGEHCEEKHNQRASRPRVSAVAYAPLLSILPLKASPCGLSSDSLCLHRFFLHYVSQL